MMLKSHEKFHSANGKRQVLVVDDEFINREILKSNLQEDYDVLLAEDGQTALQIICSNSDTLSLVLLDLMMPVMSGIDLLKAIKADPKIRHLPVIVMTADQESEIECLDLGATDFIPKPYPKREVIMARCRRTIELSEDRQIIQVTERDTLTGLYNREYFYRYADQYDQHHKDTDMDAIVLDINHFHMINERYGKAYGDQVLVRIGEKLRDMVNESGGIVCRREADTFLVYCPHREDYKSLLQSTAEGIIGEESDKDRVRLRMGVYSQVDKTIDIERRFDRAKLAADTIRNSFAKTIALYDSALHESELYAEQLIENFRTAINEQQFTVFYQPKFDVRPEIPILASAEALVRWQHPDLGMISPGVFIPLFEENGLIQELDQYVWKKAAAQIADWKRRFGISVPVSVNVSRIDMYEPKLVENFQRLLDEHGLTPEEFLLEITESAYTEDSAQIISTVNRLRSLGFQVEMDDFGTGYSSLNMISSLPIDALKLDMKFIRNAFQDGKDTRMIEVIIDIADYLGVPVIAEGVETEEQLIALKTMGCDIVQGYYFSKPVPPTEYEIFVEEKKNQLANGLVLEAEKPEPEEAQPPFAGYNGIANALATGFECIYYVDTNNGHYVQFSSQGKYEDLQIERSGKDFFGDTQRNIPRTVYIEDQERVALFMKEETLLSQLVTGDHFTMTYRLMINGDPTYYSLRAVNAHSRDNHHIVIGISNIEEEMRQAVEADVLQAKNREFFSIAQALSSDFESIYYVDTRTDAYTEFTAQGSYETLQIELTGTAFFEECRKNILRVVYPEDHDKVTAAMRKEALLSAVSDEGIFSLTYRLLIDGKPTWYRLKAVRAEEDEDHIVIGVSNVHAQMLKEQEYEAARAQKVTFSAVAQALAADYFSIYYVNTETDHFVEYSSHDDYSKLEIEKGGEDFFNLSRKNILRVVYPEDHGKILDAFTKENLLREIEKDGSFTLAYRLMVDDTPVYVSMKATRMSDPDDPHIVIGVNNIDAQMTRQIEFDKAKRDIMTYSRIAEALSRDYYSIYLVNADTDEFTEYSSNSAYQELQVEQSGENFFDDCRRNILRLVYKEDLEKALAVWDKERLMPEIADGKTFATTYRLMFDGVPVYINCKVIRLSTDGSDPYIIIGVSNVDAQMKREEELGLAREKINKDALTGVKSKHAYVEAEMELNEQIVTGANGPFAIAVCDVNGLKTVNDTLGHQAGDQLIRDATMIICNIFKHSPVFRVGGDEFTVILRGSDYEDRARLLAELAEHNRKNKAEGGVIIAGGISVFDGNGDHCVADVFSRADAEMYENKTALKAQA